MEHGMEGRVCGEADPGALVFMFGAMGKVGGLRGCMCYKNRVVVGSTNWSEESWPRGWAWREVDTPEGFVGSPTDGPGEG